MHTRGLFVCRWGAGFKHDRCEDGGGGLFFFFFFSIFSVETRRCRGEAAAADR